jgi:alpha-L-fucosidase 2
MNLSFLVPFLALPLPAIIAQGDVIPANNLPLRIGADSGGANRFAGEIACARVYARVLKPAEIGKLAAARPGILVRVPGLVGQWVFDNSSGGVFPNRSGTGLAARMVGSVETVEAGGVRAARMGAGYLQVDADPRLNATRAITLEAWVRPGVLPPGGGRILDRITAGGTDGWLLDTFPGASLRLIVGPNQTSADARLAPGVWVHVAATLAPDGTRALYLNGKPVGASRDAGGAALRGRAQGPANPLALWYRHPASAWTEAMVIGNGRLGGMVYGGVRRERVMLNEDTLWSGEPSDTLPREAIKYLPEVRRLLLAGRNREAHNLVAAKMLGPYFQSYLPLGELTVDLDPVEEAQDYRRELDLSTGVAQVSYRVGDATFTRQVFASHPAQAIIVRLTCDRPGRIRCSASLSSPLHYRAQAEGAEVVMTGRCPKFLDAYTGRPIEYDDRPDGKGMRFQTRLRVAAEGGTVRAGMNSVHVAGADSVTLVLVAATSYNGFDKSPGAQGKDPDAACKSYLKALEGQPYAKLLADHVADFRSLLDRVRLDLGRSPNASLPTDERLRAFASGKDAGLAALYFHFGRYLLISGSRPGTQPLNLQGIWNDRLIPPWASNWTLNCNAQINYWPVEVANLAECHLPLVDLTRELSVDGARVAREMYGARGWMAHHNADLWRAATPVAGDPVWSIFQVGGAWLCQHLWEHYAFSGDTEYLRSVWPTLKGAAQYFLDSMLEEPKHGWLVTAPATNFENYFRKPDGETAAVCMGPTADMQIVRELFANCVKASRILGVDDGFRAQVEKALPRLAPMQISPRTGELQEWLDDWTHASPGNGQMLSLWGLICGTQITPDRTPELAKAIRKSLDDRKPWNTWVGSWTGAFASNAFARLGDGDMALMVLEKHLGRVVNPNLSANFEGMAEWEIDGNMGQTAAIAEMLLQSHTGEIHLLPALPEAWRSGSVRGLRARGGFEVDISWKDGRLVEATLRSLRGNPCKVRYENSVADFTLRAGESIVVNRDLKRRKAK